MVQYTVHPLTKLSQFWNPDLDRNHSHSCCPTCLKGLDVSHAFMHSSLPHRLVIVLKLPLSVSMPDGSQTYLLLYKALNGLRDASLHWLNLLSDSIQGVGLTSDKVEPYMFKVAIPRIREFDDRACKHSILHSFSDASFAPYRFTGRKGISGGVVFCEGALVRSLARQQQSVSLSSCEAELYVLQMVARNQLRLAIFAIVFTQGLVKCEREIFFLVGANRLLPGHHFEAYLRTSEESNRHRSLSVTSRTPPYQLLHRDACEMRERDVPQILLESDSSSALQLLVGQIRYTQTKSAC